MSERGIEIERACAFFCPLVHVPNAYDCLGWIRRRPDARDSIQIFHVGGRNSGTTTHCFPRHVSRELNRKWSIKD